MNSHVFETFKSDPFFILKGKFDNGYTLSVKWNIFKDKKQDGKPVIRPRYILNDEKGKRISLKKLNLKDPVEFKEVHITEFSLEVLDALYYLRDRQIYISANFGEWINSSLIKMMNSGDYELTSIETDTKNYKKI